MIVLAATAHALRMSIWRIGDMTGQYEGLPGVLIASVVASALFRTLREDSIYRHYLAEQR